MREILLIYSIRVVSDWLCANRINFKASSVILAVFKGVKHTKPNCVQIKREVTDASSVINLGTSRQIVKMVVLEKLSELAYVRF